MEFLLSSGSLTLLMAGSGAALLLLIRDLRVLPIHCASVFGMGAYAAAGLVRSGWSEAFLIFPMAVACAAAYGATAALPVVRRTTDRQVIYFVAVQLLFELSLRLTPLTGGASGLSVLDKVTIAGATMGTTGRAALAAFLGLAAIAAVKCFDRVLGVKAALVGIGYDHALGMGINSRSTAMLAHVATSSLLGIMGAAYALHVGFVHPTAVSFGTSVWIIVIGAFAARRGAEGALVGALAVVGTFEFLRFVGMPAFFGVQLRQGVGGLVLAALVWREYGPAGGWSQRGDSAHARA
jgi:branched-chain amino acid transport system permease protein